MLAAPAVQKTQDMKKITKWAPTLVSTLPVDAEWRKRMPKRKAKKMVQAEVKTR